jgi:hypothetical protein
MVVPSVANQLWGLLVLEAIGVSGRVIVDDYFVTIIKEGVGGGLNKVMTRLQSGYAGEKRIPMDTIASVQFKQVGGFGQGMEKITERAGISKIGSQIGVGTTGYIQFGITGASENKTRALAQGLTGMAKDENSVMFQKSQEESFAAIRDFVEKKIVERMSGRFQGVQATSQAQPSKMDQLKQLAELRDAGILTQDEFEAEKTKVLAQS